MNIKNLIIQYQINTHLNIFILLSIFKNPSLSLPYVQVSIVCSGNFHGNTCNLRIYCSNAADLMYLCFSPTKSTQTLWPNRFILLQHRTQHISLSLSIPATYRSILRIALCYVYFSVVGQMISVTCLSLEPEWSKNGFWCRATASNPTKYYSYYGHVLWRLTTDITDNIENK